ncbi:uncharacterized protein CC84DRAFT_820256 [Paraphaeosphaeria sporulosa]|uniref:Uncharacterized protein n=1 Tax=Paraphaeosphaeria sporulosa TaxID=1460663 RepID=A0A177CCK6_9PLEO|nr:uncharacterized protein CC84DRAFT_820256 [Paraphaeosphaeria sporulosa]OAG05056.1 hypothetical protein CC84DRAFT_820256 [Paraphaeosphaeria sporulosa]
MGSRCLAGGAYSRIATCAPWCGHVWTSLQGCRSGMKRVGPFARGAAGLCPLLLTLLGRPGLRLPPRRLPVVNSVAEYIPERACTHARTLCTLRPITIVKLLGIRCENPPAPREAKNTTHLRDANFPFPPGLVLCEGRAVNGAAPAESATATGARSASLKASDRANPRSSAIPPKPSPVNGLTPPASLPSQPHQRRVSRPSLCPML